MIRGQVSEYPKEALVTVEIIDAEGQPHPVEAVLDTGFTGDLTLSGETIRQLGLASRGQRISVLANGEQFVSEIYSATVSWHERLTDVLVLRAENSPLLGMNLLWGSRITLDAISQGEVNIRDIQDGPPEDKQRHRL